MNIKRFLFSALTFLVIPAFCMGQKQWAVVNSSTCFLRIRPDYETALETQCLMGTVLEVKDADRYWRKVDAPDYKDCWTTELGLAFMDEAGKDAYIAAPKYICLAKYSAIYSEPSSFSQQLCDFTMGDIVLQGGESNGAWLKVVRPSGQEGWVREADVRDFMDWAHDTRPSRESLVALAKTFLGTPYMWGGNSVKHFDCSGFTKFVYMMNGIVLKRNAREQIDTGEPVPFDFGLMEPGDLVYFGTPASAGRARSVTHVGMYIGDGHIIHSSQIVRINSLRPSDPDFYGDKQVVGVRRMMGCQDETPGITSVLAVPWYYKQ